MYFLKLWKFCSLADIIVFSECVSRYQQGSFQTSLSENTFLIYLRRCFSTLNSLPIERVYNTQIYYYYDFPVVVYERDKRHHYIFAFGIHAYLYVDHNCNHSILINNNVDIQVYICIYNNGYIATNTFSMLVVCL